MKLCHLRCYPELDSGSHVVFAETLNQVQGDKKMSFAPEHKGGLYENIRR